MSIARQLSVSCVEDMRELGRRLGRAAIAGDVIVLSGELGAGKTTLAQGIGRGMGIIDAITSPTFVIARVHAHPADGPDLVHVDAYRLGSLAEVEDLDLGSDLECGVVVVEWGEGMVDGLSGSRIDVRITRPDDDADETRVVSISCSGDRWAAAIDAPRGGGS